MKYVIRQKGPRYENELYKYYYANSFITAIKWKSKHLASAALPYEIHPYCVMTVEEAQMLDAMEE